MKKDRLWDYVAGFVMGVTLTTFIAAWGESSLTYRIVFIVLLGLLSLATWSKSKRQNSNDRANNCPREVVECEPSNKGNSSTN